MAPRPRSGLGLNELLGAAPLLLWAWRTYMGNVLKPGCTKRNVVGTTCCKPEICIGTAANNVCILVVLPVIFPEANGANLKGATLRQREVLAARAGDSCLRHSVAAPNA